VSRVIRIGTAQSLGSVPGKTPSKIKKVWLERFSVLLKEGADKKADIISFCECGPMHGIFDLKTNDYEYEDVETGELTGFAKGQAKRLNMNIVWPTVGFYMGKLVNCAIVISRAGKIVGVYRKTHLTYRERKEMGYMPGNELNTFDLDFGRIGVLICHDMSFPEPWRVLALRGAEIIFWPSHWRGWGDIYCYSVIKSRAIDNSVYIAHTGYAPDVSWMPGMNLARSGVFDRRGERISNAGFSVGVSVAEIDLDIPDNRQSFSMGKNDDFRKWMLADRRPDLYDVITDKTLVIPTPDEEKVKTETSGKDKKKKEEKE